MIGRNATTAVLLTGLTVAAIALPATGGAWDAEQNLRAGIGEPLLLVVAEVAPDATARERLDETGSSFGALDGFRLDRTDGYDVEAVLVQTTAKRLRARCDAAGGTGRVKVASRTVEVTCPAGGRRVDVVGAVSLRRVPKREIATFAYPSPCGRVGAPPCARELVRRFLTKEGRLRPKRSMVVSGFRTRRGAEEFIELVTAMGVGDVLTIQAYKRGGGDIGLGQEPHPDGSGPLEAPLRNQRRYQS